LEYLKDKLNYPGGEKALLSAIQKIVDEQGVKPVGWAMPLGVNGN